MAAKTKTANKEEKKDTSIHYCGECANCEPYMRWETLTVKDKQPTMGTCPHVKDRKVLLSERACATNFKHKKPIL